MSQFYAWGGQSIGVSASASVLLMNIQDWFPLWWNDWISLSPRDSQESSPTPQFKSINSSALSFLHGPTLTSIHDYWRNHSLTRLTFVGNVMSLLFNILSRLVISHDSKIMFKILQIRLQQYVNRELPDVQAGFKKGRGTRDQIANICWIIKKAREFQTNIYFCFIDYAKAIDCVDHNKL